MSWAELNIGIVPVQLLHAGFLLEELSPIEVECGFSVLSGYLQCSTERGLLGIFSAALKIHCSWLECRFSAPVHCHWGDISVCTAEFRSFFSVLSGYDSVRFQCILMSFEKFKYVN